MGKFEYLYDVDLKEEGKTSRWNFNCHSQYFIYSMHTIYESMKNNLFPNLVQEKWYFFLVREKYLTHLNLQITIQ